MNDFYKYDPANDTWAAQQNYPVNSGAVKGFTIGSNGYAGTGNDGITNIDVFYEWSPGFVGLNEQYKENCTYSVWNNTVNIFLVKELSNNAFVCIYDIQGRVIAHQNIKQGATHAAVSMLQKTQGVYFIKIVCDNKNLLNAKFFKK